MDDLVEFLRTRLDEDEAHAQKDLYIANQATPGEWSARYGINLPNSWIQTKSTPIARLDSVHHEGDAMLIQRFSPANVRARAQQLIAKIDAKRRIIGEHEHEKADHPGKYSFGCSTCHINLAEDFRVFGNGWCSTLRLLALPYADHPDYQEGWKP